MYMQYVLWSRDTYLVLFSYSNHLWVQESVGRIGSGSSPIKPNDPLVLPFGDSADVEFLVLKEIFHQINNSSVTELEVTTST